MCGLASSSIHEIRCQMLHEKRCQMLQRLFWLFQCSENPLWATTKLVFDNGVNALAKSQLLNAKEPRRALPPVQWVEKIETNKGHCLDRGS